MRLLRGKQKGEAAREVNGVNHNMRDCQSIVKLMIVLEEVEWNKVRKEFEKRNKKERKKVEREEGVGMDRRRDDSSDRGQKGAAAAAKNRDRAGARGLFDIGLCLRKESEERPKMSEIMRGKMSTAVQNSPV